MRFISFFKKNNVLPCLILFLFSIKPCEGKAQINVRDSLALVDLYNSTNGANWSFFKWSLNKPVISSTDGTWAGVTVSNGRVTELTLFNNSLSGKIPISLGNLDSLTLLNLDNNNLIDSIPSSIGNLSKLNKLLLGSNQLTGNIPSSLGNLSNLTYLELSINLLSGSIPSSLGVLSKLTYLDLYRNKLTGSIPSSMGNLSSLTQIDMSENLLTGKIPSSFGNLAQLSILYLYRNQLSDSIPSSLGNLPNLMDAQFDRNQLTGKIPASLGNMPKLKRLELENNLLNGPIPASLSSYPATVIILNNNYLTFDGLEGLNPNFTIYTPQYSIPLHYNAHLFSVSAGGTLSNDTFRLYKNKVLISTKTGDSTFTVTDFNVGDSFYITVTNKIATKLTLYSDTLSVAGDTTILPARIGTLVANKERTDLNGWTNYYYDNNTPTNINDDTLLLSLKKNGQNIGVVGDGTFQVKVSATNRAGSNHAVNVNSPFVTAGKQFYSMNRFWEVIPTIQPVTPVNVRFYYNTQDLTDVNGDYPGTEINHTQLTIYKLKGGNPDPTTNWTGATGINYYTSGVSPSATNWLYTNLINNRHQAEFLVTSFSGGGAGAVATIPLPVNFLSFKVTKEKDKVLLQWTTSSEYNSNSFAIQRSFDGTHFETLATLPAAGNSNIIRTYEFGDIENISLKGKTLFYRIVETDIDGKPFYSDVKKIRISIENNSLTLLYNPIHNEAILNYKCIEKGDVQIKVTDNLGRTVMMQKNNAIAGTNKIKLSTEKLMQGVYNIELIGRNDHFNLRMLKK